MKRPSASTRATLGAVLASRDALVVAACAVTALAASWHFTVAHLGVQRWDAASLANASAGHAIVPMQYRALIPWLVAGLRALDLPGLRTWDIHDFEFAIGLVSGVALWAAVAYFVRATLRSPATFACLSALLVFPILPFHYILTRANYYYCYDIASVAFFAALLALMVRRRWWVYYPLFAAATLNRETTAFLVVIFVATSIGSKDIRWPKVLGHAAVQTALWLAIKLWLRALYVDNVHPDYSGEFFKTEIERNIRDLAADPSTILRHVSGSFAYLWIPVFLGYPYLRNRFLRRALWVVPLWFVAMFYVGLWEEARIYAELLPLVLVSFVHLLRSASMSGACDAELPAEEDEAVAEVVPIEERERRAG